jgi:hypothetical protein
MPNRNEILEAAAETMKARGNEYGDVALNWTRTATIVSGIIGDKLREPLAPADVGRIMIGIKLARLMESPGHTDSLVDLCGYAALIAEVE